jgi:glucokinase-like ROK family protein
VAIARQLGLTPAAITHITSELIEEGYIRESGPGTSQRGRKPVLLELNGSAAYVVAVEFQHLDRVGVAIVNLDCEPLWREERPLPDTSPPALVNEIRAALDSLLITSGLPREAIFGVGVSVPGIVDYETGTVILAANLDWENVPLQQLVEQTLGFTTYIDNDANVAALGEYWYGKADTREDFIYISVTRGIGSGLIMNGQLYRGCGGVAGEFGHIVVETDGPLCRCGAQGCLETFVAEPAILRWVTTQMKAGRTTEMQECPKRPSELYIAATRGDPLAIAAIKLMGHYLGLGIVSLINVLNPKTVIVGGNVWRVFDLLIDEIRSTVSHNALTDKTRNTPIIAASLGADTDLVGAATLVLEEMFQAPLFNPAIVSEI